MEALYGAAPLLAELGAGEVRLHGGTAGEQRFFVAWGFVEVLPERVTILAETALHPEEIDKAEAQQELQTGEKMWHEAGDEAAKYDYANATIREAEEKLASAEGRSL
jgi:F-type H+-transporting ATPase subunit epsilon